MDGDILSKITALLSDPDAGKSIRQMADSLSSSDTGSALSGANNDTSDIINKIIPAMNKPDKNIDLLKAIIPYLRPERAEKVNSAIKAMKIITVLSNIK